MLRGLVFFFLFSMFSPSGLGFEHDEWKDRVFFAWDFGDFP